MNIFLSLIHKSAEKTRIQARVENGFAVAEVQLRSQSDEDFKEWKEALTPKELVALANKEKQMSMPATSSEFVLYELGLVDRKLDFRVNKKHK